MNPANIIDALQQGAFADVAAAASADFAPQVRNELAHVWQSLIDKCGPVALGEGGFVLHDLTLIGEEANAHVQIVYAGEEVVGLVLLPGDPTGTFGQ